MINLKNILPFWIVLVLNLCCLLVLGWNFGPTTGYGLITLWSSIWLVLDAIFMIASLILIVLMLILSIWGISKTENQLQIGKWSMQTITEFLFLVFCVLSVFVFVFSSASVGFVSFGAILYLFVVALAFSTFLILKQKGLIQKTENLEQFLEPKKQKQKSNKTKKIKKFEEKQKE